MTADVLPKCRHRGGQFALDRWVCSSPRLVAHKGVTSAACREICPLVDHESLAESCAASESDDLGEGYGVAVGTFDSLHGPERRFGTEAVELNLAVLRHRCGDAVKILVCDDASPEASRQQYRRLCEKHDAEFTSNRRRMGHTSGDMIVFHKALRWAARLGLRTVTKLSHRMMIDAPNWVQNDSERLIRSPYATLGQMLTNFGLEQIRTECVMMVVRRWMSSGVMWRYRPRRIPYWNESHTFRAIAEVVDRDKPYPFFLPWERLSFLRGADRPPVYFREMSDADHHFRRLAERHGVELSAKFSTVDSCATMDYRR